LDLSRLEAGIVDYEMPSCDLADLIHSVVIEISSEARGKSLRLLTNIQREPLLVQCDPNRMVQLFTNLLDNAIRFSNKDGYVGVDVRSLDQYPAMPEAARARMPDRVMSTGVALIRISDSGPGIDDAHKESVFHTFHQVQHGKKGVGESLGLGLAICRAIVQAHRGTIWTENNAQGGAVFCVLLPRAVARSEQLFRAS